MPKTRTRTLRVAFWRPGPTEPRREPDAALRRWAQGLAWLGLYLAIAVSPLVILLVAPHPVGRDFWVEFSVALGFVGLSVLCLQFALTARFRRVAAPFGLDMILQFHRQISYAALGMVLAHPLILWAADRIGPSLFNPFTAPWGTRLGLLAVAALALLIVTSLARRQLRLSYEGWRLGHAVLAVVVVGAALGHVLLVGHYLDLPWKRALWDSFVVGTVLLLLYVRLGKPLALLRRPYVVERVEPERGNAYTLVLRPRGHGGMRFKPGQFGWLRVGTSPFSLEEHPFSFSSSAAEPERLSFTIKALGDYTSALRQVAEGARAYVDGPYGAFTLDRWPEAPGFVFLAGGVGITPFLSMLKTMADRGDRRPVTLFYANKAWEAVLGREALDALARRLDLTLVHVLDQPPEGWAGERGFISAELLARHLSGDRRERDYFLCGPPPMMAAIERALLDMGVPLEQIHAERFNLV